MACGLLVAACVLLFNCLYSGHEWVRDRTYQVFGIRVGAEPSVAGRVASAELLLEPLLANSVGKTRFVCVSDTHGQHWGLKHMPEGDVLLHAGDFSMYADEEEVRDFNTWLGSLNYAHKVVIGGNHDFTLDESWCSNKENVKFWERGVGKPMGDPRRIRALLTNCTYICNETVTINGVTIFGSPVSPPLYGHRWAFADDSENLQKQVYDKIPIGIDVLLTHTPPYGQLDQSLHRKNLGCKCLLETVKKVRPKFHVFGHIHDGYGVTKHDGTVFINAASCTTIYHPYHVPIVFDVAKPAPSN